MCMYAFMCVCVSMYHMHAWCVRRSEEGVRSPGIGIRDGCGLPCGYWETKPGPFARTSALVHKIQFCLQQIMVPG